MDYYVNHHFPMVQEKLRDVIEGGGAEYGVGGGEPGAPPIYVAVGHFLIESPDDFWAAWGPHHEEILADIPNYTNIEPVVQMGEVRL